MSFELDASEVLRGLSLKDKAVMDGAKRGLHDSMDDLKRISVNIAPIDTGTLRRSASYRVMPKANGIVGELTFSATEKDGNGHFNYAYWTHEMTYKLGHKSKQAPGTDGYEVGNKYVERPLKGEANKYMRWIAEEIRKEVDKA